MDEDFQDVDVISELNKLSDDNKFQEISDLLRDNLYQFNNNPVKLVAVLTIRIYYNLQLKRFNDAESDFQFIESIFRDKLQYEFPYTRDSTCPFSTFLLHAYFPHLKGSSFLSLDRLYSLLNSLQNDLMDQKEGDLNYEMNLRRLIKTVLLTSDVLVSVLRPLDAIKLLKNINLKYDEKDISTNLLLSLIYRKLGYIEESEKYIKVLVTDEQEYEKVYEGFLKVFKKDYKGAYENFKELNELEKIKDSKKNLKGHELVLANNLAVTTLYAGLSQEAKNLFFGFKVHNEGFQAQRGISSNADVLKELSIYN